MRRVFVSLVVMCSILSGCSSLNGGSDWTPGWLSEAFSGPDGQSVWDSEFSFEEMSDWFVRRLPSWMIEPTQAEKDRASLTTAGVVDLDRYGGRWYEIASLPSWSEKGCVATTVTYKKVRTGGLSIVTRCLDPSFRGKERVSYLDARVDPDRPDGSHLLVGFVPFIEDDYWILEVDPDYRWALVGSPDRQRLWVLSRQKKLDRAIYRDLVAQAAQLGYSVDELVETLHSPSPS